MTGPPARPDRATADDLDTFLCDLPEGVEHDWRPYTYDQYGRTRTSWRCVWCHALACGDYGEPDPCWRPHHHLGPHRARSGHTWPIGGNR